MKTLEGDMLHRSQPQATIRIVLMAHISPSRIVRPTRPQLLRALGCTFGHIGLV